MLVQVAWAASHTKGTIFGATYRRWAKRLGKKKALVAVGHKILGVIYKLLKDQIDYLERLDPRRPPEIRGQGIFRATQRRQAAPERTYACPGHGVGIVRDTGRPPATRDEMLPHRPPSPRPTNLTAPNEPNSQNNPAARR